MRNDPRHAGSKFLARLKAKDGAFSSIPHCLQRKANIRPRHRQTSHDIKASGIFAAGSAQELAARGHLGEQFLHPHPRAGGKRGGLIGQHCAMIDHPPPAFCRACLAAFDGQPRDAGDGWQRLSAKA